jgi:hypothetical protein
MSKDEKKKSKKNRKDKDRKRSRSSTGTTTTTTTTTPTTISSSASKKTPKRIKKEDSSSSTAKKVKVESTLKPTLASTSTSTKKKTKSKVFIKQLDDNNTNSTDSSQLRVQVASDPSTSTHPIVVSFPAGLPPSMTSISSTPSVARSVQFEDDANNNNNNSSPPVFTWSKVRQSSTRGRLIYGTDDTCTYISSNEGRGHDSRLTKFYVGVYHKPTGSIKFIPSSEKGTVFALNQSVTSYNDTKSMDFRNLSIAERRRMVFESFGSQKKKKVLKSQQANIVEMRSVVGAGEGMMKSLGKQMDGNMMSDSNVKVMEELKRNGGVNGSGKVSVFCFGLA